MAKKRLLTFLILFVLVIGIARITAHHKKQTQVFTVGICQFAQHESLDAATLGFKDALTNILGDRVSFDEQNANGDYIISAAIIQDMTSKDIDLILANSTSSLQAASTVTQKIPILGTAVTDYSAALQLENFDGIAGGNISGTSDFIPPEKQAAMIQELFPHADKIGMIYCSSESNSRYQVEALQTQLEAIGYSCEPYVFVESNDLSYTVEIAASDCDVIYIPTDNTIASNAGLIANICTAKKIPVITADESTCRICGAATLSVNYYDLGYTTGEMAAQILAEGKDISSLPVQYASSFTKKYNKEICEQLEIVVPEDYVALESK